MITKKDLANLTKLAKKLPPRFEEKEQIVIMGGKEAQALYDRAVQEGTQKFHPDKYYRIPVKVKEPVNHYRNLKKLLANKGTAGIAGYLESLNVTLR